MSTNRTTRTGKSQRRPNSLRDCGPATQLPVRATGLARCARLWALRIIGQGRNLHTFVQEDWFLNEELALALGLDRLVSAEDFEFDRQAIRADLVKKYRLAERSSKDEDHSHPVLDANIALLTSLFNLNRTEQDLLKFSVLAAYEGVLREACHFASLKDVPQILGHSHAATSAALSPKAALERSGLLTFNRERDRSLHGAIELISTDFPAQMIEAPLDCGELLRGQVNTAPSAHLTMQDFAHLRQTLAILQPHLKRALNSRQRGVNIFLYGPPGTGKTQLARAIAAELGHSLLEVACEDKDDAPISGERRLRALRAAYALLQGGPMLIAFDEAEDVFNDGTDFMRAQSTAQMHKGWINRMLEDNPLPTLWLSNSCDLDPAFLRRFDIVLHMPVPPRSQRLHILRQACGDMVEAPCLERLADMQVLAPAVATRAASVVRALPSIGAAGRSRALEHLIDNTLQAQGHGGLQRHSAQRMSEIYDPAFIHADADLTHVAQSLAGTGSGRLCLYGPPGTGKTAYGHWLAKQLEKPMVVRRASDLLSPYVGQAEQNIASAFREAEHDGALLLIDEVDSFLLDRRQSVRSWETTQVNEMLTQMESFTGIFIASTNRMDVLDQAALRRFDLKVRLGYLQAQQALELLRRHCMLCDLSPPDPADIWALQRLHVLTPGDFAVVLRQNRLRPLASAAEWVAALQLECSAKEDGKRASVGFLA